MINKLWSHWTLSSTAMQKVNKTSFGAILLCVPT